MIDAQGEQVVGDLYLLTTNAAVFVAGALVALSVTSSMPTNSPAPLSKREKKYIFGFAYYKCKEFSLIKAQKALKYKYSSTVVYELCVY